jgi:hypothetical protein
MVVDALNQNWAQLWGKWTPLDDRGSRIRHFVNSRLGVRVSSSAPRNPHHEAKNGAGEGVPTHRLRSFTPTVRQRVGAYPIRRSITLPVSRSALAERGRRWERILRGSRLQWEVPGRVPSRGRPCSRTVGSRAAAGAPRARPAAPRTSRGTMCPDRCQRQFASRRVQKTVLPIIRSRLP